MKRTATHCPYCGLQCGMTLAVSETKTDPGLVRLDVVVEERDFPTNRGAMCRKGWTAGELFSAGDRLTTPLVRDPSTGDLRESNWEAAIEKIVEGIKRLQRSGGPHSVGVFGGGGLTNETAYMLGKFTRVALQSRSIDYNGRFCMASAAVAQQRAFGIDRGMPFPIADLLLADVVLLAGANPADTMPPLMQYFDERRAAGKQLIVIDSRKTRTAEYADIHLQPAPGTDLALAHGLLHVIVREGMLNQAYIDERTSGFDAVRSLVNAYWPDRVQRITGVDAQQIERAARLIGGAPVACTLTARGVEQQRNGVSNLFGFINLMLALGQPGKPGGGFGSLTGQANGQGGREHGQKSDQLPGYRKLDNPEHRAVVAERWGIEPDDLPGPGASACEMLESIAEPDGLRGLLVFGSNLVVSAPNAVNAEQKLKQLELLVVADAFLSETAQLADVVLPVCHWAEHDGTTTNLEGRLLLRQKAIEPPPGVLSDLEILERIAIGLGKGEFITSTPELVFGELARVSAGGVADYGGASHGRLRAGDELFWPCADADAPGTPRLFADHFDTESGRAQFLAVHYQDAPDANDSQYPYTLTTGRTLAHYQTGTQTHRVPSLEQAEPEPFVELHSSLAQTYDIHDGDWVLLESRQGRCTARARFNDTMRLDTLFVPFHWSGTGRINSLTSRVLDPESLIPEFKRTAVALRKADA